MTERVTCKSGAMAALGRAQEGGHPSTEPISHDSFDRLGDYRCSSRNDRSYCMRTTMTGPQAVKRMFPMA